MLSFISNMSICTKSSCKIFDCGLQSKTSEFSLLAEDELSHYLASTVFSPHINYFSSFNIQFKYPKIKRYHFTLITLAKILKSTK